MIASETHGPTYYHRWNCLRLECNLHHRNIQMSHGCWYMSGCILHCWFDTHPHLQYTNLAILYHQHYCLTSTIKTVETKCVSYVTGTFKGPNSVSTCLVTSSIVSLTLIHIYNTQNATFDHSKFKSSPSQSSPSSASVYPMSQEHSNEPYSLVQVWLHPPLLVRHSSISVKKLTLI